MNRWLLRLRGALSLGVLGALSGATIAAGWEFVSALLGGGLPGSDLLLYWTLIGASVGGASGLGFAALVSTVGATPTIQGMSVGKAGLWGGVAGAIASCLVAYTQTGALVPALQGALPFIVFCTATGVALGGGALRVAKVAAARELTGTGGAQDLIGDARSGRQAGG